MIKVLTFGTFDIIHPGHVHLFKQAKEYGDFLIIVIARDQTVCEVKGHQPKNDENIRLQNVISLNIADKVRLGCLGDDKYKVVKEENPDIVALGYDQKTFIDRLSEAIRPDARIIRLQPFMPEIYKSSKLT